MGDTKTIFQDIHELLLSQQLAVLATNAQGQPYASLVAFAARSDLQEIYLATSRSTRKYANLISEPRISLLIDSRSNQVTDFHQAEAVTILGQAQEVEEEEREPILRIYLAKHPHLEGFVRSPSSALLKVNVRSYYLVSQFQKVMELHLA